MEESFEGKLIITVDDDPDIVSTITDFLTNSGFRVKGFLKAESFFKYLKLDEERPDLIILDVVLPDMNGLQICKTLKDSEDFSAIPIIILSGRDENTDKAFGLEIGADDYMAKPYSLEELLARVKAVLRRGRPEEGDRGEITVGDNLVIDLERYEVRVDGKKAPLTPTEFRIFKLLASRKGHAFTRETILGHLWGEEKIVVERTVDVHIRHLREKLGSAGDCIQMVKGVGYMIEE